MNRCGFLAGTAAGGLARSARAGKSQTPARVPQNVLNSTGPIWTTARIARNTGFMVFDMLYGNGENAPRPSMIASGLPEDGAKRWIIRTVS
jgi:peptide/nickel transport system substrate-binding protein